MKSYFLASIGILIFSLSLPMTKIAVNELNPYFVISLRTLIAGVCGLLWLAPRFSQIQRRTLVEIRGATAWQIMGVVVGFPLLSSIGLQFTGVAHAALIIAMAPLLTSILISILFQRKSSKIFWSFAFVASATVVASTIINRKLHLTNSDILLIISALLLATGYAFGVKATAKIGGATAISLATACSLPFAILGTFYFWPHGSISTSALLATLYLGSMSMFAGFIFWYEGLLIGPSEHVSLIQCMQLFFTYFASALLLKETISFAEVWPACIVAICIAGAKIFS